MAMLHADYSLPCVTATMERNGKAFEQEDESRPTIYCNITTNDVRPQT
jgi:hypothetical protein